MSKKKASAFPTGLIVSVCIAAFCVGVVLNCVKTVVYQNDYETLGHVYWTNTSIWNEEWALISSLDGLKIGSVRKLNSGMWHSWVDASSKVTSLLISEGCTYGCAVNANPQGEYATFYQAKRAAENVAVEVLK